jgi:uncharacterized protein
MNNKCIVFYHRIDFDGKMSAALVKRYHKHMDVKLYGVNWGDNLNEIIDSAEITNDDIVFVVDFCFDFDKMKEIEEKCLNFVWIDHHVSAIEKAIELNYYPKGLRLVGHSACELCWEFFNETKPFVQPRAVRWLGRFDVWDHSDEKTIPFQYGLKLFDNKRIFKFLDILIDDDEEFLQTVLDKGYTIEKYEQEERRKNAKKGCFELNWENYKFIALNTPISNSFAFVGSWDQNKYDAMLTFFMTKNFKWRIGMYSDKDNIDLSQIAKKHGGGGHYRAAAFICDKLPFKFPKNEE